MNDTKMIMETVAGVGQLIIDEMSNKVHWCPEANRYSRAIVPDMMIRIINTDITKSELFVLFNLINAMNSSNKIGKKFLQSMGLPRMTLYRAEKKLTELGIIYEFEDGSIMVNPNVAMLTKFRKMCLSVQKEWKTATTKAILINKEEL